MASAYDEFVSQQAYSSAGSYSPSYDPYVYEQDYTSYQPTYSPDPYADYGQQYGGYEQPSYEPSSYDAYGQQYSPSSYDTYQAPAYEYEYTPQETYAPDPAASLPTTDLSDTPPAQSTEYVPPPPAYQETGYTLDQGARPEYEPPPPPAEYVTMPGETTAYSVNTGEAWRPQRVDTAWLAPSVDPSRNPAMPAPSPAPLINVQPQQRDIDAAASREALAYDPAVALGNSYEAQQYGTGNPYSTGEDQAGLWNAYRSEKPDPATSQAASLVASQAAWEDQVADHASSQENLDLYGQQQQFAEGLGNTGYGRPTESQMFTALGAPGEAPAPIAWLGDRASNVGTFVNQLQQSKPSELAGNALGGAGDILYGGFDRLRDNAMRGGENALTQAGIANPLDFVDESTPFLGGVQQALTQTGDNLGQAKNLQEIIGAPLTGALDVPLDWSKSHQGESAAAIARGEAPWYSAIENVTGAVKNVPLVGELMESPMNLAAGATPEEQALIERIYAEAEAATPGSGGSAVWEYAQSKKNPFQRGVADIISDPLNAVPFGRAATGLTAGVGRLAQTSTNPLVRVAGRGLEVGSNVFGASLGATDAAADLGVTPLLSQIGGRLKSTPVGAPFRLTDAADLQRQTDTAMDNLGGIQATYRGTGSPGPANGIRPGQFGPTNSSTTRYGDYRLIQNNDGEAVITRAESSDVVSPVLNVDQADAVMAEMRAGASMPDALQAITNGPPPNGAGLGQPPAVTLPRQAPDVMPERPRVPQGGDVTMPRQAPDRVPPASGVPDPATRLAERIDELGGADPAGDVVLVSDQTGRYWLENPDTGADIFGAFTTYDEAHDQLGNAARFVREDRAGRVTTPMEITGGLPTPNGRPPVATSLGTIPPPPASRVGVPPIPPPVATSPGTLPPPPASRLGEPPPVPPVTTSPGILPPPPASRLGTPPTPAVALRENADEISRLRRAAETGQPVSMPVATTPGTLPPPPTHLEGTITGLPPLTKKGKRYVVTENGRDRAPTVPELDVAYARMLDMPETEYLSPEAAAVRSAMYGRRTSEGGQYLRKTPAMEPAVEQTADGWRVIDARTNRPLDPRAHQLSRTYPTQEQADAAVRGLGRKTQEQVTAHERYLDLQSRRMQANPMVETALRRPSSTDAVPEPIITEIKRRAGVPTNGLPPAPDGQAVTLTGERVAVDPTAAPTPGAFTRTRSLREAMARPSNVARTAGQAPAPVEKYRNLGLSTNELTQMQVPMPRTQGVDKDFGDAFFAYTDEVAEAVELAKNRGILAAKQTARLQTLTTKYSTNVDELAGMDELAQDGLVAGRLDADLRTELIADGKDPALAANAVSGFYSGAKQFLRSTALYNRLRVPAYILTNVVGNPMTAIFKPSLLFGRGMLFDSRNWDNVVRQVRNEGMGIRTPDMTAYGQVSRSLGYPPRSTVVGATSKDQLDHLWGWNSDNRLQRGVAKTLTSKEGYLMAQAVDQGWREVTALTVAREQLPQMVREIRRHAKETAQRMGVLVSDAQIDDAIDGLVATATRNRQNAGLPSFSNTQLKDALAALPTNAGPSPAQWADRVHRDWREATGKLMADMDASTEKWAFSFRQTNADDLLSNVTKFHVWASRASKLYVTEALKNPALLNAYIGATEGLNTMAEEGNYPDSVKGFIKLFDSVGGFTGFIEPQFFMPGLLMGAESVYREDGEYGLTKAGEIIQKIQEKIPLIETLRAFTYFSGMEGGGNLAPDPLYGIRDSLGAVANVINASGWLGKLGIEQADEAGILPAPVNTISNRVAHWISGLITNEVGLGDAGFKQVPLESEEYLRGEYQLRQIVSDLVAQRNPELDADGQAKLIDETMADTGGDLYQDAYGQWADLRLAKAGTRLAVPLQTRIRNAASDERAITKAEGNEAEQAAAWEIDNAVRRAGPEDAALDGTLEQYSDAYDGLGNAVADTYFNIIHGEVRQTFKVNGQDYFPEQIAAMSESERYQLAERWMEGISATTGEDARARMETRYDAQNAILDEHPDLAGAVEFRNRAREYGPGGTAGTDLFIAETAALNAPYRQYLDGIPEPPGTDEYRKKATSYSAAQMAMGEALDVFNPVQDQTGTGRVAGLPEETSLAAAHHLRQAEREEEQAAREAKREESQAGWNEYVETTSTSLMYFNENLTERAQVLRDAGVSDADIDLYFGRVAGEWEGRLPDHIYRPLRDAFGSDNVYAYPEDADGTGNGGAFDYWVARRRDPTLVLEDFLSTRSAENRAEREAFSPETGLAGTPSFTGELPESETVSTAADPTSLGVPHPEFMPGGSARQGSTPAASVGSPASADWTILNQYDPIYARAERNTGVPANVIKGVQSVESGFGAYGPGQQVTTFRVKEDGSPDPVSSFTGIFETTAISHGLDYQRILNEPEYAIEAMGTVLGNIGDWPAEWYGGPAGQSVVDTWGWEGAVNTYFSGKPQVTGWVDELGNADNLYTENVLGRIDELNGAAPAGGPTIAPSGIGSTTTAPVAPASAASASSALNIVPAPTNNYNDRGGVTPQGIVYHITGDTNTEGWIERWQDPNVRESAHYVIAPDGTAYEMVNPDYAAWTQGDVNQPRTDLQWLNDAVAQGNVNSHTIGIEFIGDGNLTPEQYAAGVALTQQLSGAYGIPIDEQHIIGHSDINSVGRNLDPGPYFPMTDMILAANQHGTMTVDPAYNPYADPFWWQTAP